jgi:hypothetical protein
MSNNYNFLKKCKYKIMKKYLFFLLGALPITLLAQKNTDSITLKNGKTVSGKIFKMDDGLICLARTKDTVMYTADEVQTIMFCNSGNTNKPCGDAASNVAATSKTSSSKSKSISTNASTFSSFEDKEPQILTSEVGDTERGLITFKCNMCGGSGVLKINGENSNSTSTSTSTYTFTMEEDTHFFVYAAKLLPGKYNWKYSDNSNNVGEGKLLINKGDKKKIILFENE